MKTKQSNEQTGLPLSSSSDLLARVMAELLSRRGETDVTAAKMKIAGRDIEAAGWQCRAAGLAEAIAVLQTFMEASRANK